MKYNKPMTIGDLKNAIKDIPDDITVNVLTRGGESTSNIYVWFEDLQTRKFVELIGEKPLYKMDESEKAYCRNQETQKIKVRKLSSNTISCGDCDRVDQEVLDCSCGAGMLYGSVEHKEEDGEI